MTSSLKREKKRVVQNLPMGKRYLRRVGEKTLRTLRFISSATFPKEHLAAVYDVDTLCRRGGDTSSEQIVDFLAIGRRNDIVHCDLTDTIGKGLLDVDAVG